VRHRRRRLRRNRKRAAFLARHDAAFRAWGGFNRLFGEAYASVAFSDVPPRVTYPIPPGGAAFDLLVRYPGGATVKA
jgi:hypothetical protein